MEVKEYQEIINKTAIYPKEIGLSYCALGLTGEAGEVANKVKKIYRDKGGVLSKQDAKEIAGEVADTLWYIAALAKELGTDLGSLMEHNYKKLMKRKVTNTLGGSGDNRENNWGTGVITHDGLVTGSAEKGTQYSKNIITPIEEQFLERDRKEVENYLIATHVPRK